MLQHSAAERFKRTVQVSKGFMPRRQRRAKLPRKAWPKAIAREYYQRIVSFLDEAHALVLREITPMLPGLAANGRTDAPDAAADVRAARLDAGQSEFNQKMDELSKQFFDKLPTSQIEALAEEFARRTSSFEKTESMKQIRAAFGVDVMANEPHLAGKVDNFVSENVALIKSIPSQFFDDVEKHVLRAVREAQTSEQLGKVIADRFGVAQDRATLIARDQLGKFYGEVAGARQQSMGVTHYIWRTSNDERVREEHAAREGQTFAWDDPPEDGNPGEAINCRCFAEPDLTPLLNGDEPIAEAGQGGDADAQPAEEPARPPEPSPEDLARQQADEAEAARKAAEDDAQRARDAQAEEASKRLAEQEIARENMRLLREAMAKQQAEHEAELARLAAEKQAAEEQAARVAAEAESKRIADEAAARAAAEQAAKPPLQDKHLAVLNEAEQKASDNLARNHAQLAEAQRQVDEIQNLKRPSKLQKEILPDLQKSVGFIQENVKGYKEDLAKVVESNKFARAREEHLAEQLKRPPDPGKLAASLGDIEKPKAQAAVRDELNRISAHEGGRIQEADLTHADGKKLVIDEDLTKHGFGALHTWNGEIQVAGGKVFKYAQQFFSNLAIDPNHYRDPVQLGALSADEKAFVDTKTAEKDALRARMKVLTDARDAGEFGKKAKTELDSVRRQLAYVSSEVSEVHNKAHERGLDTQAEIYHSNTLIHETMHGHSPMAPEAYRAGSVGVPVEEITTELAARAAGERQFGVPNHEADPHWRGTYQWFIGPAVDHLVDTSASPSREEAYKKLTEASLAMKRDHTVISTTPDQHLSLLANHLADAYGIEPGKSRNDFIQSVRAKFTSDIANRTPKNFGFGPQ